MLYSNSPDFVRYSESKLRGEIQRAKLHLQCCLDSQAFRSQPAHYADLLQRMAEIAFLEADHLTARRLLNEAESADPNSLLAKLVSAEFIGTKLGDVAAAKVKCDEIERLALSHPFPESGDDFSSDTYLRKARELRAKL